MGLRRCVNKDPAVILALLAESQQSYCHCVVAVCCQSVYKRFSCLRFSC